MLFEELFTLKIKFLPVDFLNPPHKIFKSMLPFEKFAHCPNFQGAYNKEVSNKHGTLLCLSPGQCHPLLTRQSRNTKTLFSSCRVNLSRTVLISKSRKIFFYEFVLLLCNLSAIPL